MSKILYLKIITKISMTKSVLKIGCLKVLHSSGMESVFTPPGNNKEGKTQ